MTSKLLHIEPQYRDYVWGGYRLRPNQLTAEAWIVFEGNRILSGPWAGQTLRQAAHVAGADLLGEAVAARTGRRFPLLIKILDCREWLSVQVHPDDAWAARLAGPEHFGKTEAWYVLDARPDAQLIAGVRPGTSAAALAQAIQHGAVSGCAQYHHVQAGDALLVPARTLHALGPGVLVYEVQQTSDLTYRIYDWDRPAQAGRALHLEQAIAVTDAQATAQAVRSAPPGQPLVTCPYFTLTVLAADHAPVTLDTRGASFHALTVIDGQGAITCGAERAILRPFETVLVSASAGAYTLHPIGPVRALQARAA